VPRLLNCCSLVERKPGREGTEGMVNTRKALMPNAKLKPNRQDLPHSGESSHRVHSTSFITSDTHSYAPSDSPSSPAP
jgi:hypothetical protein